jgi:hypothetical protein
MCIVVGVGIVNRWFVPSTEPDAAIVEQLSEHDEGVELKKTAPPDLATDEFAAAEEAEGRPAVGRGRRDKEQERIAEDEKVSSPGAGVPREDTDDQPVSTTVPEPPRASDSRTTSVFWTQGQLLAVKAKGLEEQADGVYREQATPERGEPLDVARAAKSGDKYRAIGEISQAITLQQQPFSTLDPARQQSYEQVVALLIPTRIEQRGDSLYLTLYPDSPFSDIEMQTAKVVPLAGDSLIVTVGSQQIGYHLPPSLIQTQSAKTRR